MLVRLTCKSCSASFKVDAKFAGRVGTCPNAECGKKFLVPAADAASRSPAGAQQSRQTRATAAAATAKRPAAGRPANTAAPSRRRWYIAGAVATAAAGMLIALMFGPSGDSDRTQEAVAAETPAAGGSGLPADHYDKHVLPFLQKFCIDCHGRDFSEADLNLERFPDEAAALKDHKTWDKVVAMLEIDAMPPEDHEPRPTLDEVQAFTKWIDQRLYFVDCNLPADPGRVTIRRLNRAEYNNTIRDLVGIDFKPAEDFPSDDVGYGFDNIGDVLSLPPLLMEKYLDAAEQVVEKAVLPDDQTKGQIRRFALDKLQGTGGASLRSDLWAIPSVGMVFAEFDFPLAGEYLLRASAEADQAGPDLAKMEFRLADKPVEVVEVTGQRTADTYEIRIQADKGRRRISAGFINDYYQPNHPDPKLRGDRNLYVRWLEIQGPLGVTPDDLPESHRRIVFTRPQQDEPPRRAAGEVLRKFTRRAWRRPVTDDEIEPFVRLVEFAMNEHDETFERSIQLAVQGVLVSPHFLFRIEQDRDPNDSEAKRSLNDYELASRLSYFLWSSMPDEELFDLADKGLLGQSHVLEQQVRRMIQDPKSQALVENFAVQWLNLRNLEEVTPDPDRFPEYDEELRDAMSRETELLFAAVMREDRSVFDFLDADFTHVNERLAKHYGFGDVTGDEFQRVSLPAGQRAGVLTHASILTLTSNPTRTSPVKRGKWIMENILGTPPPPAPPNVPELEDSAENAPEGASLREQLVLHRTNPGCASCHKVMDPLGFGFENFDAIGRWREHDGPLAVDPSGELPGGENFSGPVELIRILKKRDAQFRRSLTERLLTFALGRGLEYYDRCAVDEITKNLSNNGDRFSALVIGIVRSEPFLMRRGEKGEAP